MKYVISVDEGKYVKCVAWFEENLPLVTLTTTDIKTAQLFDSNDKEEAFRDLQPNAKFIEVNFQ